MKMTQLSVSSVILAAVLTGCSQQQVIGGSQVVNGSGGSQMSGSSQIFGGSQAQIEGGSQVAGGSQQVASGSQISGSQQQVQSAVPVITSHRTVARPAPRRVYSKPIVKRMPKPRAAHSIRRGTGLPPAKPGQCFAKVKTPAKYVTKSKRVLIQRASAKRVLVRAPQYRWIAKKVLVRKAQYINRTIPAVYRNVSKRVQVRPAYHTWKKGHGAITRIDNMTGQIMCRVTVPAVYKNVTKRVIVRPQQNVRKFVPAVYKTVKQKKRVSGALYKTVQRPARYKTQNYRVQVAGARYVWRPILCATNAPKKYKQHRTYRKPAVMHKPVKRVVHKQQYRRPAANSGISFQQYSAVMNTPLKQKATKKRRVVKKSIKKKVVQKAIPKVMPKKDKASVIPKKVPAKAAVETKATDATKANTQKARKVKIQENIVYGIQAALKSKGFDPGKLDGKMGPKTATALKAFQGSRGLPVGVLSKDTFRALGLVK